MTAPSLVGTGASLLFVLGLLVGLGALLRRLSRGRRAADGPHAIEVLSRAGLAQKQGVAAIRVGGRAALVSWGEGGVRLLMTLDDEAHDDVCGDETEHEADGEGHPDVPRIGEHGFKGALTRAARKVPALRAFALGVALALALPAAATAAPAPAAAVVALQTAPARSEAAAAAQAALQGMPDVRVQIGGEEEEGGLELSGPVGTVLFVGFLTVLPTLLLLMTSFTRILVVLHLLKQALGTQTAPPAHLLTAMALILTGFVMAPTLEAANDRAIQPWMAGEMDSVEMMKEASVPFRAFMLEGTREQDLAQFVDMSSAPAPETVEDIPLTTLTAAFVTSELTSAFQMGFALFLPFVVIDLVVASVLMSMGMFMLPPVMVSLPFKLLLFVLVDGWSLVLGSLVASF